MNVSKMAVLLLLLLVVCPAQQEAAVAGKIVLRMLNGKTGKPIWRHDYANIWLGNAAVFNRSTDSRGEVIIDVSNVQPPEIRFLPNTYFDCRSKRDNTSFREVKYSLDEIISKGVVGENVCGKTRVSPTPGVLVMYVRPRTFIEGWNL
jgi:hypothetical protein